MKRIIHLSLVTVLLLTLFIIALPATNAATTCAFTTIGKVMALKANCTTDTTIFVPNGFTLDGRGHTIIGVDPVGGHFVGAVVENAGTVANVINLHVTVSGLMDVCDDGEARLRGIMFEGASGTIIGNTINAVTQVNSGCQEGNSIEVRNDPFDGTHPNTKTVLISGNHITNFMKTGIVANGDVNVAITLNIVGASANQAHLAANSVQLGFGAKGTITLNTVAGNSWCCEDAAATGILVYQANDGASVRNNSVLGNADIGIDFDTTNNGKILQNIVSETGPDGFYDIGIGNYGMNNLVAQNVVHGYQTPYDGLTTMMSTMSLQNNAQVTSRHSSPIN